MSSPKNIKTLADWRLSYENANKYLLATLRLINEQMMATHVGADPAKFAKQRAIIRKSLNELDMTSKMLEQNVESLKKSKKIIQRDYMDLRHDLTTFQQSLKDAHSKVTVSVKEAVGEEFAFHS